MQRMRQVLAWNLYVLNPWAKCHSEPYFCLFKDDLRLQRNVGSDNIHTTYSLNSFHMHGYHLILLTRA